MKFANIALLSVAAADDATDTPFHADIGNQAASANTGFYLDMGGNTGINYLNAKVGEQWLKLGINTCSSNISVVG